MTEMPEIQNAAFTIEEFMKFARLGRTKTYSLLNDPNSLLKCRKVGRKTLILRKDAEAWLESLPEAA